MSNSVCEQVSVSPSEINAGTGAPKGRFAWIDLRECEGDERSAIIQAALHHRIAGIVSGNVELLDSLPPTITRILVTEDPSAGDRRDGSNVDLVLISATSSEMGMRSVVDGVTGVSVLVRDAASLQVACEAALSLPWTLVEFTDPTKIPLEIVIAASNNAAGRTVSVVESVDDARIVLGVLEQGPDGVLLAPKCINDVIGLSELCADVGSALELCEMRVQSIHHIGMGERACIDTCSLFEEDEGILVGSFSQAFILACSETHPLPYMPTRPFRVNAGAVHSYVVGPENRTQYLSELRAGAPVLAVRANGVARRVSVGRVKIERRPLLAIDAVATDGRICNLVVQDDWHVRVLGPNGEVLNVTELSQGSVVAGYVPTEARHVGYPVSEFCQEM